MDTGSLVTTFLVVFRESLEASLIVGIILTLLAKMKQQRYFPHVWASVAAAIVASALAGWGLMALTESAKEGMEKIIEGGISLAACGVLTYMIFWMDKQAKTIRPEIELRLEGAISRQEYIIILTLPFLAILREGAETILFLGAIAVNNSMALSIWGGLSGFVLAVAIVALIFMGGRKIPLKPLFQYTGFLLLLIAAGLLAYGIHEFQEIGLIPEGYAPVWNINHILNEKEGVGAFLKAIFGYNGNPSFIEVVFYAAYIAVVFFFLKKRTPKLT
jgi:high-affinity iron transporter